ncbi:MAG: undecaprenyldiphospho-muramoylpentapeptide beta-N-acetylglucosaminyltransferase [Mailhella sp.]|nr:undecaprenyldiphospho-muramoylpentapeptide beta-N-acetylglucosaminyltransferase [Mailhella sp.]
MPIRIILTTGGTGGHIFPALAVAESLKAKQSDAEILFIGGTYGPEKELVEKAGVAFVGLPVRGFIGRGLKALPALGAMSTSIGQAMNILKEFRPNAVMGFGGYASFPTLFASWLLRYPCAIHEQNAIPGAANKLMGKMARRICLSWPQPDGRPAFAPASSVLTGNPIRAGIARLGREKNSVPSRCLLVMGGSQGARAVNSIMIKMLPELRKAGITIVHQTGKNEFETVAAAYAQCGFSQQETASIVHPFIHDMASVYAKCDLALCRAGATSMAELASAGIPAVYIPFPFAAHDHQTANAKAMQDAGGGVLLPQQQAEMMAENGELAKMLTDILNDESRLAAMRKGALSLAHPDAAGTVADELLALARNNTPGK